MTQTIAELERKIAEQNQTIDRLMAMNRNTAKQAVDGFKADLAASLKSLVEDASIPEANTNAEVASALLEDLLDVLRFHGVINA